MDPPRAVGEATPDSHGLPEAHCGKFWSRSRSTTSPAVLGPVVPQFLAVTRARAPASKMGLAQPTYGRWLDQAGGPRSVNVGGFAVPATAQIRLMAPASLPRTAHAIRQRWPGCHVSDRAPTLNSLAPAAASLSIEGWQVQVEAGCSHRSAAYTVTERAGPQRIHQLQPVQEARVQSRWA